MLPSGYPFAHSASIVIRLRFAAIGAGAGGGLWQPPVLLDCFQQRCSTDIYATRNCAQASDGSLGFLKGNCMKIHFSHLQKFFVLFGESFCAVLTGEGLLISCRYLEVSSQKA